MTSSYQKIRRRIRDLVTIFISIITIALGLSAYRDYQQTTDELFSESRSHVRIMAEHASRTFGEVDRVLDIVSNKILESEKRADYSEKEIYDAFSTAQKGIPQIVSIFLADDRGILSASSLEYPIKKINLSDREYFQHHRNTHDDEPFISRPYKNRISGKWNFVFSQRINKPDDSFAGIIAASLEIDYFESLYAELFPDTSRIISLVRNDGYPIVSFPPTDTASIKNSSMFSTHLSRSPIGVYREKGNGSDRMIAYGRLPANYPLVARITCDWNGALAVWQRETLFKAVLILLFGGLAVVLTRLLMRRLFDLEQSEEQRSLLSLIIDQSPVSVVVTAPDGAISYVNPCFSRLTGYSIDEATGQNPRILKTEFTSPDTFREMWSKLASGQGWSGELCNKKKDGSLYWETAHLFPVIDGDGTITHYAAVKEDITERKQFLEEIQRARKVAEAANTAKSEFLANMSHEIRTPMNAITGMAYLTLQTDLNDRQRDYVGKVLSASESLLGIINDILDFSKIEAGKMDLEAVTFDLSGVFDQVANIMTLRAEEKGLEMAFSLPSDVPRLLVGDPLRLSQVLNNLVSNSVKFTERGGIILTVTPSRKKTVAGRIALIFSVTDTGIGMDDEQIGRIFAPFSQVDSSIARRYGGTGLGLSIVKSLVDLMGGALEVVSNPDRGSRFSFTIELGIASEDAISGTTRFSSPSKNLHQRADLKKITRARILLVEDNPTNQLVAQEILHQAGMHVEVVASGRQALDSIDNNRPFDLVFMDIQMPDMDGYEITRLIRERHDFNQLPIVAMTAHAMSEIREKCLAAGMNDFVAKPISPSELYAALVRWIRPGDSSGPEASDLVTGEDIGFPSALPGINVPVVLERLDGNGRLLRSLLIDFTAQNQQCVAEIRRALDTHDLEQARRLLHTLKGTSGNLGADSVYATTRALEDALREDPAAELTTLLDQLQQEMNDVFRASQQLEKSGRDRKIRTIPAADLQLGKDELEQKIKVLAELLRGNKAAATKHFKELRPHLPDSPALLALEDQINRLDFKKGLLSLKQLAQELHLSLEEQQ